MYFYWLIAGLVGVSIVMQNGISREISKVLPLPHVIVLNSALTLLLSALFLVGFVFFSSDSESVSWSSALSWRPVFAAFCGWLIITGMPFVISKIGALKTISVVIAVQLGTALLWDMKVEGLSISYQRIIGAIGTLLGAWWTLSH